MQGYFLDRSEQRAAKASVGRVIMVRGTIIKFCEAVNKMVGAALAHVGGVETVRGTVSKFCRSKAESRLSSVGRATVL